MSMRSFIREEEYTGVIGNTERRALKYKLVYAAVIALLICVCIITLFPTLWVAMSAFKSTKEYLQVPPTIFPKTFEPEKLVKVLNKVKIGKYLKSSVIIVALSWFSAVVFNGLAGYSFAKLKPIGSNLLYRAIFITMLMPTSMNMIPLYITFTEFPIGGANLINTYIPMFMLTGISCFDIMLFKNFFATIPTELLEAARLDGAGELRIFTKIILPMSRPIIAVVSIFAINGAWSTFFWPFLTLKKDGMMPVSVLLYSMASVLREDEYMVLMLVAIIPPLIIFLIFQKKIMGGINVGGVKG